jgi:hypothetical protein
MTHTAKVGRELTLRAEPAFIDVIGKPKRLGRVFTG